MINNNILNTKGIQSLVTTALLASSVIIAMQLLPLSDGAQAPVLYTIRGSTGLAYGAGPLFVLDADLFPHQCGKSKLAADGSLALFPYTGPICQAGVANLRPHLYPTDLRIPWALVPTNIRQKLHKLSVASLEHAQTVALRLFRSPFFAQDYIPQIQDILGNSLKEIWSAPAMQEALSHANEIVSSEQGREVLRGLLPIVTDHARQHFWRTMSISISALIGSQSRAQQDAIAQLVNEILTDPRVSEHLSQTIPTLFSDPKTVDVGATVIREAINVLLMDPRLQDIMLRLFTDRRFLRLRPIGTDAQELFATLPTSLLRMRYRLDHNPLVSYVLRAIVRGNPGFLVILLTPEQEQLLAERNLPPEPTLGRISP